MSYFLVLNGTSKIFCIQQKSIGKKKKKIYIYIYIYKRYNLIQIFKLYNHNIVLYKWRRFMIFLIIP